MIVVVVIERSILRVQAKRVLPRGSAAEATEAGGAASGNEKGFAEAFVAEWIGLMLDE